MTIDEILRRIVRAHLNTILLCVLIPLAVVSLVELKTPATYTAQVRLQTLSGAPDTSAQADGLTSRVLALATTPTMVQSALEAAGQPASATDAMEAATHRVTAEGLGGSSVVVLSVLAETPDAAARTVSALAKGVTDFMNQGTREQFDAALADVTTRSEAALRVRDRLQDDLANTYGLQARSDLHTLLAAAQNDLDAVRSEKSALTLSDVSRDQVVDLDAAHPTVERVASALLPRAALAVLLGLLVGLALAVVQETMRPRIAGIRVLARLLDAPILGSTGDRWPELARSMTLAARRQGVETVVLVGVDDRDEKLAHHLLQGMLPRGEGEEVLPATLSTAQRAGASAEAAMNGDGGRSSDPTLSMSSKVHFTDRFGVTVAEEPTAGVVVVSAGSARRTRLDDVQDIVRAMRWPVVGVVEVAPRRRWLVSR